MDTGHNQTIQHPIWANYHHFNNFLYLNELDGFGGIPWSWTTIEGDLGWGCCNLPKPDHVNVWNLSTNCPNFVRLTIEKIRPVKHHFPHDKLISCVLRCCPKNHGISKLVVRRSKRTLQKTHPNPSKSQGPVVLKVDKRKQQKTPTQHIRVVLTIPPFPKKNAPTCTCFHLPRHPSRR